MSRPIRLTLFFVLPLAVSLSGCVSTKTTAVDRNVLAQFRGATITVAQREKPTFVAQTAGKAAFGVLGVAAAASAGNDIIRDNDVPDPAVAIGKALLTDLVRNDGLQPVDSSATTDTMDVEKLAKQYANADMLLDVQTINWSWIYFPTNWNHYRLIYSVKLRLIDTKHARLVADGFCARKLEKDPDEAPTRAQLVDNGAAGLKKELADAGANCIEEFRTKALLESTVAQR